jgi:hypothetical protein
LRHRAVTTKANECVARNGFPCSTGTTTAFCRDIAASAPFIV